MNDAETQTKITPNGNGRYTINLPSSFTVPGSFAKIQLVQDPILPLISPFRALLNLLTLGVWE